jgi:cytoskeletal protein RodZ
VPDAPAPDASAPEPRTPGAMLRRARQAQKLPRREAAERLNWIPSYVETIERDDYAALRRPAFARGYVKAYGRLLGLDETVLLAAFDELSAETQGEGDQASSRRRPVTPGRVSGLTVGLCVLVLSLLAFGLWWWRQEMPAAPGSAAASQADNATTGEEV